MIRKNAVLPLLLLSCAWTPETNAAYIRTDAASCGPVDLRPGFTAPVRDQGEISWCYAHSAADYLQYLYHLPEPVSAADIAIRYAGTGASKILGFFRRIGSAEARNAPPETGFLALAVRKAAADGWCPESRLPSDTWSRVDGRTGERKGQEILKAILETYELQRGVQSGRYRSVSELPATYEFAGIDPATFYGILKNTRRSGLLAGIREAACRGARRPYPGVPNAQFQLKGRHVFQRIHDALNRQEPISIDFFSGIFENLDHYRRKVSDLHTVLVFGRKFDSGTGECQYLIRNSYGAGCSGYDPKIRCEAGYLWLPEGRLHRSLTSTVRIENTP